MSRRHLAWLVLVAVALGCGWYKSVENQQDQRRQVGWRAKIRRLEVESYAAWQELMPWIGSLRDDPAPRRTAENRLNEGRPFETRHERGRALSVWKHPLYGIEIDFDFNGQQLVGHRASLGTANLTALHPQPARTASASRAESIRKAVVRCGGWIWLTLLLGAACRRGDPVAAEALLVSALAWATALLVSPHYTLDARGIFSNDMLLFGALACFVSIVYLAGCAVRAGLRPQLQFGLRTLLATTGVVAALVAMGPFGYVVLAALFASMMIFFGIANWAGRNGSTIGKRGAVLSGSCGP